MNIQSTIHYPKVSKGLLPLLVLTLLALVAKFFPITLIFDIRLSTSSIFLFTILRLFGLKKSLVAAVFVNSLEYMFFEHYFHSIVSLLEIGTVGFIYQKTKRNMTLWDTCYWLVIGSSANCLLLYFYTGQIGLMGYSLAFIYLINGVFNSMIADVIATYIPVNKLLALEGTSQTPPSILRFLIHLSIAGILGPVIFYLIFNSWSFERSIQNKALQVSQTEAAYILKEIDRWSNEKKRALQLKSVMHIGYVENLFKVNSQTSQLDIYVVDKNYKILASNDKTKHGFSDWHKVGQTSQISNNFYCWIPDNKYYFKSSSQWIDASYIYETALYDFKLIIKVPVSQYMTEIFNTYMLLSRIIVIFSILVAFMVFIINKVVLRFLSRLLKVSTGLPEKLRLHQSISWPDSNISELKLLTSNFMAMSYDLESMIVEYQTMNENLEQKTVLLLESEQKLHQMAYYDALTGLPNRFSFTNYIKELSEENADAKQKSQMPVAVMLIDLDRFKQVNDTMGHLAGDILLKTVAQRLNKALDTLSESKRFAARLGGDEFVVIVTGLTDSQVMQIAQSIVDELKSPILIENQVVYIGASIGVSIFPYDGNDMSEIVKNADISMYAAKESGGNAYRFYSNIGKSGIPEKMRLEHDMHKALERKEYVLYYQPKVDATTRTIIGAEALIRWVHPVDGLIMPEQFIALAEETGFIIPIGEWVLLEACLYAKGLQNLGHPNFRISVNCSILQFHQQNMAQVVLRILQQTGLSPASLDLEITESFFSKNPQYMIDELTKLRDMGVHIFIDDFGKGYSSLFTMKKLPVHGLKIDNSLIKNIPSDPHDISIVRAAIQVAHDIELKVVAEGVETLEAVNCLVELGCDEFQGYYFSTPVSADEFVELFKKDSLTLML